VSEHAREIDVPAAPASAAAPPVHDAGLGDVRLRARRKLAEAEEILRSIDPDWEPPPYDPWLIAQALGIRCIEVRQESFHGAMICMRAGEPVILYRRQKDEARTRFSLFHEIAHTLFPGFGTEPLPPGPGTPLLEPEGRLERLCDAAALEMLLPEDHFRADLTSGFSGDRVAGLCRRYHAGMEAVALRMVDSDEAPACAVALVEHERPSRWHRRQHGGEALEFAITYATYSTRCREQGWFLARRLNLAKTSCLRQAARSGKSSAGREPLGLLNGDLHDFTIEAIPLTDRPRRKGRSAVLAFFYPE
jgi:Zn-dependent peptidase ImmA (M78 family)